jgi:two-component system chemotaxis sensor kinase CheA
VLILDPLGLARALGVQAASEFSVAPAPAPFVLPAEPRRLLLFRAGKGALKVVPLSLISRIESINCSEITSTEGARVIKLQNSLMPLIDAGEMSDEDFRDTRPILVIDVGGELMGLLVSEIVDVIEDELDIEIAGGSGAVLGSAIVRDEPVEILDVSWFMKIARPGAFSRGHARRFRILLVDDKMFFRDMLSPIISAAGYDVSTAASASDALRLFEKGAHFDAVVTDIDMPEMDGYAFARELHNDEKFAQVPMLALAAHAAPAVLSAANAAGMRGAVGKFDRKALIAALSDILDANAFNNHAIESRIISGVAA